MDFNETTGEEEIKIKTKHIKKSTVDPDSGHYHKGEHEQCFAYAHNTCSDKHGFVIDKVTTAGNVHDSTSFKDLRDKVMKEHKDKIKYETLDAGYKTPAICREIIEDGKLPMMPYTRPKGKKGLFSKKDFGYNEEEDYYICPNYKKLEYSSTDKRGYKIYKSDPSICINCPLKDKCTKSKNNQKQLTVHVWNSYVDYAEQIRHSELWKMVYPLRKETIERTFGDCKENMGLRFTRVRGLRKNENNATMIFACHNLKKMALWKWEIDKKHKNEAYNITNNGSIFTKFLKCLNLFTKKLIYQN